MTAASDNVDLSRARWRKSTRSTAEGQNCVEIAAVYRGIAVRDSKDPEGPKLIFAGETWRRFTRNVRRGSYEL